MITRGLLEEVSKLEKRETSEQTMFAISGDMAAGKSSVINSILSVGTVARKGAGGGSCTWVVQRFMKAFDGQTSPFAARITFFTDFEIRAIIASLLLRYYRASNLSTDEEEETDGEDLKSQNYTEIRTTLDVFSALFADRPDFSSDQDARKYLSAATSETDINIIDELATWACDVVSDELSGNDCRVIHASTSDELLYHLQPFTYQLSGEEADGQVSTWPLVKTVDFGLDHPLLNEGIVLVDAPGLSDSNSTRAGNAIAHHRACTHKIIVADVARARDDKSLRDNLAQSYSHRGTSGTILVLTRGDDIDTDTDVNGTAREKRQERQLHNEIKALGDDLKKFSASRRGASIEERFDIDEQISEKRAKMKVKMQMFDTIRMKMRNQSVLKALQDQYKDLTHDPKPLAAFVVGNEAYKKHQVGYAADEKPALNVRETGVVALRARIYLLPPEGKLNDAFHLANVQLSSLINFFELYCSKTHFARKAEIGQLIDLPAVQLSDVLRTTKKKLGAALKKIVLMPMSQMESSWVQDAHELCREWAVTYRTTHLPIMRRQGYKRGVVSKNIADVCWNNELLAVGREKTEESFRTLQNQTWQILQEITKGIMASLTEARQMIRADPQFNVMALGPFLDSFKLEQPVLTTRVDHAFRVFRHELAHVGTNATTPTKDSYLVKAMGPIYEDVVKIKGRNGPVKRLALFESRVCEMSGVWLAVHDGIDKRFDVLVSQLITAIHDAIRKSLATLKNKFNAMCEDNSITDEKEKILEAEVGAKLTEAVTKAKALHEGPIQAAVDACKRYDAGKEGAGPSI